MNMSRDILASHSTAHGMSGSPAGGAVMADCNKEEKEKHGLDMKLLKQRTIVISSQVDRDLLADVSARLLYLDNEDSSAWITIYVNSPGGDADSGFAIYDLMKYVKSPVRTVCSGLCASAGIIILLGGKKGNRYSLVNSRFMIHQPSTGTQGDATDIEITAREITKTRERYNRVVSEETGREMKKVEKDVLRDYWMNADEAIEYGMVDKIVEARSEIE